ncbi:MAG: hypothetical protein AAGA54_34800 [Myxococcota bacterium]
MHVHARLLGAALVALALGCSGETGAESNDASSGASSDTDDTGLATDATQGGSADGSGPSGTGGASDTDGDDSAGGDETGDPEDEPLEPSTRFDRARQWSVPSGGWVDQGFVRTGGTVSDPGDDDWTTIDLTGDGVPDLVVTGHWDGDAFEVFGHGSDPHWNVHPGGTEGFAAQATAWAVPEGGWMEQGFVRAAGTVSDPGDDDWTTIDLTGDGILDLVVTGRWDGEAFEVPGHGSAPHWDVYEGGENGFATTATAWAVPNGGWANQGFVRTAGTVSDPGDDDWTTMDLTGDGVPDLVVTGHWDGENFEVFGHGATPHWEVYEGGATGFAESPTQWPVPSGGWVNQGFVRVGGTVSDPGDDDWTTTDLTGDGRPDLVVTGHWDGDAFEVLGHGATPHWDVYEGGGRGFSDTPIAWAVPDGGWIDQGFVRIGGTVSDPGDDDWTTTDLNGDGYPDLVVTGRWDGEAFDVFGFGESPYWNVYTGSADGFALEAASWPVPEGGWTGQGFVRMFGTVSDPGDDDWTTTDLNGDGYPDLVVTGHWDGDAFEVLGYGDAPHWRAFFGTP